MTRRQAQAWLAPMRACLQQIRDTGCADEIGGNPVTRLHALDDYARIDACIAGFLGMIDRLMPALDTTALHRVEIRLEADTPLTVELIDESMRLLRDVENELLHHSVDAVKAAVLTEQIQIELDEMKDAA